MGRLLARPSKVGVARARRNAAEAAHKDVNCYKKARERYLSRPIPCGSARQLLIPVRASAVNEESPTLFRREVGNFMIAHFRRESQV